MNTLSYDDISELLILDADVKLVLHWEGRNPDDILIGSPFDILDNILQNALQDKTDAEEYFNKFGYACTLEDYELQKAFCKAYKTYKEEEEI
jgi:hypothetical protein